jgi:hypothetical protein
MLSDWLVTVGVELVLLPLPEANRTTRTIRAMAIATAAAIIQPLPPP